MVNKIELVGKIENYVNNDGNVTCQIVSRRLSGTNDIIPITGKAYVFLGVDLDKPVEIQGYIRTNNENRKLILGVVVTKAKNTEIVNKNTVLLSGNICKKPHIKENKRIACAILGTTCAYIPCVAWEPNTSVLENIDVGAFVLMSGRLQSRTYQKIIDGVSMEHITYEVAISIIDEDERYENSKTENDKD